MEKKNGGFGLVAAFDVLKLMPEIIVSLKSKIGTVGKMFDEPTNGIGPIEVYKEGFEPVK